MMRLTLPLVLMLAAALAGCSAFRQRIDPAATADAAEPAPYLERAAAAQDLRAEAPTAVESALAWSEKYARAVEDLARQQEETRKLADEKRTLLDQTTAMKAELERTQQELKDANDLLLEVRRQNDKWKSDVLGYRDEARAAHKAELEALLKVLRLLGGEVPEPAAPASASAETGSDTGQAAPPAEGATGENAG